MANTKNLVMGPGAIYVMTYDDNNPTASEPLDSQFNVTPPVSAWTDVGFTVGGLQFTVVNTWKELEADQITETPERRRVKKEVQFKTQLGEVTFDNLVLTLAGGTVTTDAAKQIYKPPFDDSSVTPPYQKLIFDGRAGKNARRRVTMRKVLSTENIELAHSKDDQTVIPVTFTTHYVNTTVNSWQMVTEVVP